MMSSRNISIQNSRPTRNSLRTIDIRNYYHVDYHLEEYRIIKKKMLLPFIFRIVLVIIVAITVSTSTLVYSAKMVRLCIASVDPIKLASQCVMCSRREFPLTAIDCTGITKMNDLIANPLSVQEARCLIYNCKRQVPDIKPEPYHGSISHATRTNYPSAATQTRTYGMMPPHGMFGGSGFSNPATMFRYPSFGNAMQTSSTLGMESTMGGNGGLVGRHSSPDLMAAPGNGIDRPQALPYAIVPAAYTSPFGTRKYKAALVPLFR